MMLAMRSSDGSAALLQLSEQALRLGALGMLPDDLLGGSSRRFGLAPPGERLDLQQGRF